MTWQQPRRSELAITALAVGWAAALLIPDWLPLAVLAVVYLATLPCCVRRPPVAVGGLIAGEAALWVLGVDQENPAGLVAFAAVFCLGRWSAPAWLALPLATLPTMAWIRDDLGLPSLLFVAVVVTLAWGAGRLVRRHDERAADARREAAELAATDPAAQAGRLVAEERARLAGEALAVVRAAVDGMLSDAERADRTLDPSACAAVQAAGRRAVTELRRLLGLLRAETEHTTAAASRGEAPRASLRHAVWPLDAALAVAAVAVVLVEAATVAAGRPWQDVALTAAACLGLALLRTDVVLACLVSALPIAVSVATGRPLLHGLELVALAALLGWFAGADGRTRAFVALTGWTVVTLVEARLEEPGNEAMLVALVLLGAVPGRLWQGRRSAAASARATATRLRAVGAEVAERAVRAERLRLARELHDVASAAIGVMVLQAAAAQVQCGRDPAAAHRALAAVRTAGTQAQAELAVLFGLLDAGAVGAVGLAGPAPVDDLPAAVAALVERMRAGGLDVLLDADPTVEGSSNASATAYRVVQEALTNVVKHAPGSRVRVTLRRDGAAVCVDVVDDGPGGEPSDGGFGLVGLTERVRADGGELAAGPHPDGGFRVSARLPVRSAVRPQTGAAP